MLAILYLGLWDTLITKSESWDVVGVELYLKWIPIG